MKKYKFVGIMIAVALAIGGCGSKATPSSAEALAESQQTQTAETTTAAASETPSVVTDVYNRQVELPEKIETIAAIGGAARILTYAGCADKLVGVTDMDKQNVSTMPYTAVNAEAFKDLTSVGSGGSNDTCYIEALVTLQPDVIFGLTDEDTIKDIAEKTGIPTIGIYPTGMFDDSFYSALDLIGNVMETQEHCTEVVDYIKKCQTDLNDRTKDIPDDQKPTVYTGAVSFKGAHGFEGTYGAYPPFDAVNGKNVVDETGKTGAMLIDLEKVMGWNPDIIFLNPSNMELVNEDYKKNAAFYDGLKAVQNGEVYSQISYNYNWTNMEISIADAYYAGKIIYPKQFENIDMAKKADEIFTVMLGQPFYEKLVADGSKFDKITIGE